MNDELAEIRISNLEQRIDRLAQEVAQGKQGDNVQNAQLPPFVPIPRITGEDQKPFDIETDDEDGARSVVRCVFYWGKEEVELPDYSLDEIPATGNATLYLTRTISEGEPVYALTTDEPEEGDEDTSYYKIYDFTDGEVSCDYRATFLTLGISAKFVGDMEGSEVIDAANDQILVTGHPGEEDAQGQDSHSGILFLTVSGRTGQGGEKIPAKIIARIKDKEEDEDWGAKTMTVTDKDGNQQSIHFLGCDDVDIDLSGSGGGGAENVIGSDYIKVEDEEEKDDDGNVTTKRKVSAKIQTSDPNPSSPVEHALLTHDTDQLVRSKKTFLGSSPLANSKKVIVDGPNGKVEVQNAAGNRIIKLDAADIPNECGQGEATTIQVRKLTVAHPRTKDGKTADIYHFIGCADIDVQEGDAIDTITSGAPTQSGGFTLTPVTIKLKDGTTLPAFNISAKNGADGDDGDDAGLKVTATTHQPTQSDPRTGVDVVLTPTINGVDQTPTTFTIYNGKQGVGIGSIEEDPSKSSGRTRTYNVMSDEAEPKLLGTVVVTDGRSIGSVVLESSSGKTRTYAVMSADTPAVKIGTFTVTDGEDGDDGDSAGFGTPTATATELESGSTPTVAVTASGTDKAKVFAFQFGIPKGRNVKSDWNAQSGSDAEILNKPTALKNPHALTLTKSGATVATYDGSSAKTFDVIVRNLVAGSGIGLSAAGNDIVISNTAQGGGGGTTEGFTGTAPWLDGFKYDKTAHKLMYRFGSIRFENGLAVEYTPGGDDDFVDVPGGDAVEETV